MFGAKPTALDRVSESISDIGEKIADLESRVVERLNPTPSSAERLRRAIVRTLGGEPRSAYARYMPDALQGLSVPSLGDARAALRSWQGHLPDVADSISDARRSAASVGRHVSRRASALTLPVSDLRVPRFGRTAKVENLRGAPTQALLIAGGVVLLAGAAFYVTKKVAEHTEEPDYDVVRQDGEIEIRDYDAMVVAETVKSGYHEKARRDGFETLADYIFASNRSGRKISMTAPVLQQLAEGQGETRGWAVRFVMPKKYLKSALPAPASNEIELKDVPAKRVVAIRFAGNFNATLASKKLMALYNYLADENLKQVGDPEYAFYNPPWTPGFMRRNEILIAVER